MVSWPDTNETGSRDREWLFLGNEPAGQADFTSRSAVSGARRRTAKAEFKAAWEALKAGTAPEQLVAAYKAMNIRDHG